MQLEPGHLYAFGAGLSFAISDVMTRVASRGYKSEFLVLLSLLVGTPYLWLSSVVVGESFPSLRDALLFLALGPLHFGLARLLFYKAIAGLGASSAAITTSPTIILSSLLAWIILGEALTPGDLAGAVMVAVAVFIAGYRPSGASLQGVRPVVGLAAGLGASLVFSISSVVVRYAGSSSQAPIMGSALSYTAALPVAALITWRSGFTGSTGGRRLLVVAVASGIVVSTAQLLRYTALSLVPVVEALILISLFPLHTLAIASLVGSHGEERIKLVHVPAAILAISGIALNLIY